MVLLCSPLFRRPPWLAAFESACRGPLRFRARNLRHGRATRTWKQRGEVSMLVSQRICPCLWFDDQAEEAANYYVGIFKNSRIKQIAHYGKAGFETHHRPAGSVMTVAFELDGNAFNALNGGPLFKFTEAISLQVNCAGQKEIDYYWEKLTPGGDPSAQVCG